MNFAKKKFFLFVLIPVLLILSGCTLLTAPFYLVGETFKLIGKVLDLVGKLPMPPPGVF